MTFYQIMILAHVVGTAIGVGGATLAEVLYMKSLKDGIIDPSEGALMKMVYYTMRVGIIILILSGFGFFFLWRLGGKSFILYSPAMWAKLTIVAILLLGVIAWKKKWVPMWLGGAFSLVSWYAALFIGVIRGPHLPYWQIMLWYFVAGLVMAGILAIIRKSLGIKSA